MKQTRIKWIIPFILFTLVASLFLRPTSAVLVTPVDFFNCENEWYNVTNNSDFHTIQIAATYVVFNTTGFNLSSAQNAYIYLEYINPSPLAAADGTKVIKFYLNTSLASRVWYNISGLTPNDFYNVTQDGAVFSTNKSNATGSISFRRETTGKHSWMIYPLINASNTPIVTTNKTTGIRTTNATLHGYISSNGSTSILSSGFQYGTTDSLGSTVSNSTTMFEYTTTSGTYYGLSPTRQLAQTFKVGWSGPNISHYITGMRFYMYSPFGPPGTLTASLYISNNTGCPTGAILATGSINANNIGATVHWRAVNFTVPYKVEPTIRYCIVLSETGPLPGQVMLYNGPGYQGVIAESNDAGVTWKYYTTQDFRFQEIGFPLKQIIYNLTGLSPGTRYFVRAFANNSGGTGTGTTERFITIPDPPSSLTATSNSSHQQYFSWTSGSGANNTIIVAKLGSYPTNPTDGSVIVNTTLSKGVDAGVVLNPATAYYLSAFSWTRYKDLNNYSTSYANAIIMTKPSNTSSLDATKISHGFNVTLSSGGNWNKSIIVRNGLHYPSDSTDGDVISNSTHQCYEDTILGHVNGSIGHYRVFTYAEHTVGGVTYTAMSPNNMSFRKVYSNQTTFPLNTTNKEETTVTLNSIYYGDSDATCGWWIGTSEPLTELTATFNISAAGTYSLNDTFSASIPGLTSAQYYYVKAWYVNQSTGATLHSNASITKEYFLTKPNPPSTIKVTHPGGICRVEWTNASIPASTPVNSTIVCYQASGPPTNYTEGTSINVSSNHTTISGLIGTVYFSVFHYIQDQGSPGFHWYSDTYLWTMATLEGGVYNLTIRYENTTYKPINLSKFKYSGGGNHTLIVHYLNKTEYNHFIGNSWRYAESTFSWSDPANGSFALNCTQTPIFFEFHWNDSVHSGTSATTTEYFTGYPLQQNETTTYIQLAHIPSSLESVNVTCYYPGASPSRSFPSFILTDNVITIYPYTARRFTQVNVTYTYSTDTMVQKYRCNRIIVPVAGQYNRSIYVFIDKMVYGDYTNDINNTLVRYTYSFQDKTGYFDARLDLDSYVSIYTYDMNNTKLIIHEEFLDATAQVYPWLLFEKRYFIGIACSVAAIERIGIAPTSTTLNPQIIIPLQTTQYYNLNDIIVVSFGWENAPPGCWVSYQDTVFETNNVSLRVYNMSTGNLLYWHNVSSFLHNFSCPVGNQHQTYYFILTINHTYWALNQTITGILYPYAFPSHNGSYLNYLLNITFGQTPFVNEETGDELPWIYVLIGAVAFFILLSFATINAFAAVAGSGLWLALAGTFFSNLPEVGTLGAAALVIGGFFMVILALIAALGGYGR